MVCESVLRPDESGGTCGYVNTGEDIVTTICEYELRREGDTTVVYPQQELEMQVTFK